MSDGAAGVLLMSAEKARQLGLRPRARIVARTVVGEDPILMLTGVIPATRRVLDKAGLRLDDIDVIEINEAFASVVKAWERELEPNMAKVNPRGGAIALGHPLGASGARLMTTLLHELEDMDGKYGLQVMCIALAWRPPPSSSGCKRKGGSGVHASLEAAQAKPKPDFAAIGAAIEEELAAITSGKRRRKIMAVLVKNGLGMMLGDAVAHKLRGKRGTTIIGAMSAAGCAWRLRSSARRSSSSGKCSSLGKIYCRSR
ncbi:putative acyltransferase [Geobacillus sp. BCO2]|nr:putative acyltransferase [Geobacillus sp. BCO2]